MAEEQEQKPKLLSLRLPVEMYNQVSQLAEKERRSIHSQLLVLIEDALKTAVPRSNTNPADYLAFVDVDSKD